MYLPMKDNIAFDPLNHSTQNSTLRRRNILPRQIMESGGIRNHSEENNNNDSEPTAANKRRSFHFGQRAHEKRKERLYQILEPDLDANELESSSILLCWGTENECHIIPVKVKNSANDVDIWQEIRRTCVREVNIVKISIAGREPNGDRKPRNSDRYIGTYNDNLESEIKQQEQIIANYEEQEYPCPYNPSTGIVECNDSCISSILDVPCPMRRYYKAERKLKELKMRPFLTLAFSNPDIGETNALLGREVINSNMEILSKLEVWHRPKLGELEFCGLLIREGWRLDLQHIILPSMAGFFFLMVVGAKLLYGDWATAWNFGCFLISLATLLWM
ncbi:hypothetical protein B7463_g11362, partial [Scytalidium lignicola]